MKKLIISLLSVASLVLAACAPFDSDPKISVLYVGQNPDTIEGYGYGGDPAYIEELKQTRAAEFMGLLDQHFNAKLVYGEDYKPEMSASYDVTIFDALPMELNGKDMDGSGYGAKKGERFKYAGPNQEGWRWLPEDFDHATIFVAGSLNNMADDVNLALSCLCNCLGKTAFNLKEDHPIFNAPYKVPLDYKDTPYAGGVFHYYTGRNLPKSTDMIQMEVDDLPNKQLPPGIVTVPGVGDSPDTEVISGGTCIKDVDAIAIARHGNFLQWGFRSSPRHMTEPARLAFLNAVHYIKDFKGAKKLISKKSYFRMAAMDAPYKLSDQGWEIQKRFIERINARNQALHDKVAAGTATEQERKSAKFVRAPMQVDRSRNLSGIPEELQQQLGDDWNAYLAYYEANMGYIYPKSDGFGFEFDKDAQQLGIANNDVAILDRAITLLERGENAELAQRILTRYTVQDFTSATQWRNWYRNTSDRLFFTEVGGYKFIEDTL